jgi:hypothetical protein
MEFSSLCLGLWLTLWTAACNDFNHQCMWSLQIQNKPPTPTEVSALTRESHLPVAPVHFKALITARELFSPRKLSAAAMLSGVRLVMY